MQIITSIFAFDLNLGPLISTQSGATFTAYNSYNEAYSGTGTVLETIKKGIYQIFIRVEIPGGCFAVVQVNMDVTFTEIKVNEKNEYILF